MPSQFLCFSFSYPIHILQSKGGLIGKPCKGRRIRTCTLAKRKLLLLFLSKEKGGERWQSFGIADSMSWTGINCMAWLCVLLLRPCSCSWGSNHKLRRGKKHGNWFVAFTLLFPVHACMTARWSLLIQLSLKAEFNVLQFSMTLFCSGSQNRWHMITKIAWSNCLQIVSYCEKSHLATVSELYILVRFLLIYLNNY
jgi:hypothetical protein